MARIIYVALHWFGSSSTTNSLFSFSGLFGELGEGGDIVVEKERDVHPAFFLRVKVHSPRHFLMLQAAYHPAVTVLAGAEHLDVVQHGQAHRESRKGRWSFVQPGQGMSNTFLSFQWAREEVCLQGLWKRIHPERWSC